MTRVIYRPTIKELPSSERPRERLLRHGANALSSAELLAVVLRTGARHENVVRLAQRLLASFGGLAGLARASPAELMAEKGLGPAKVAQLKAALELGRRLLVESPRERPRVILPDDAANLVMSEMSLLEQEHLRVMLLDSKNYVLATPTVAVGSLNTNLVRVGEIFREAIRANCASLIVLHNHPSGDPTPSAADVALTRRIVEAGRLLGIEVIDHLIIGRRRFVSLKDSGLGFEQEWTPDMEVL